MKVKCTKCGKMFAPTEEEAYQYKVYKETPVCDDCFANQCYYYCYKGFIFSKVFADGMALVVTNTPHLPPEIKVAPEEHAPIYLDGSVEITSDEFDSAFTHAMGKIHIKNGKAK